MLLKIALSSAKVVSFTSSFVYLQSCKIVAFLEIIGHKIASLMSVMLSVVFYIKVIGSTAVSLKRRKTH